MTTRKKRGGRAVSPADVLQTATRLFADKGYFGTSLRDIAVESDVGLATLYHHFGDKRGLYTKCLRTAFNTATDRHLRSLENGSMPSEHIRSFVLELCATNLDPIIAKLAGRDVIDEEHLRMDPMSVHVGGFVDEYVGLFKEISKIYDHSTAVAKAYAVHSLVFGCARLNGYIQGSLEQDMRPTIQSADELGEYIMAMVFPDLDTKVGQK